MEFCVYRQIIMIRKIGLKLLKFESFWMLPEALISSATHLFTQNINYVRIPLKNLQIANFGLTLDFPFFPLQIDKIANILKQTTDFDWV